MEEKKDYQVPTITVTRQNLYDDVLTASSGFDPEGISFDDYDFNDGFWW